MFREKHFTRVANPTLKSRYRNDRPCGKLIVVRLVGFKAWHFSTCLSLPPDLPSLGLPSLLLGSFPALRYQLGNMRSLAPRTVASTIQLHSLTHRMCRAKQEKVSTSNPPLTAVRGGKKLTPFILLCVCCSFGGAKRFLFCARSIVGAPPANASVSFAESAKL